MVHGVQESSAGAAYPSVVVARRSDQTVLPLAATCGRRKLTAACVFKRAALLFVHGMCDRIPNSVQVPDKHGQERWWFGGCYSGCRLQLEQQISTPIKLPPCTASHAALSAALCVFCSTRSGCCCACQVAACSKRMGAAHSAMHRGQCCTGTGYRPWQSTRNARQRRMPV
jgi:hypothetical protein